MKWHNIPGTQYKISDLGSLKDSSNNIIKGNYNRGVRTYRLSLQPNYSSIYLASDLIRLAKGEIENILPANDKRKQPKTKEHKEKISDSCKGKKGYRYLINGIMYSCRSEASELLGIPEITIAVRAKKEIKGYKRIKI